MESMSSQMDIALIGRGKWGRNYINTLRSLGMDLEKEGLIKSRDYPELFELPGLSGVIIASATDTHFTIAKEFIQKGYHALIEKPITKTLEEALELQRLHSQHKDLVIMAGHIQIYDPGYQELKKALPQVGKIKELTFRGSQEQARTDSSVLENWGPHPIYMFMDILGGTPFKVQGKEVKKDDLDLEMYFDNSVTGRARLGMISSQRERSFSVIGEEGVLTLDWAGQKTLTFKGLGGKVSLIEFSSEKSPLALEVNEFIECIKTGREPKTPLSQGVEVARVIDAFQKQLT